jgi:ADP-heptose:LPS heptosyltransferase
MLERINYTPKKILIIKLKKLGDVIGTTPITRQIRGLFPKAEITFITEPLGAQVYKNSTNIDQLWVLSRKPSISEYVKLCYGVNREKFDLVIDLYDHNKTALFSLFSFARFRLGFAKKGKRPLSYNYTVSLSQKERSAHNRIWHQLKLTDLLGTDIADERTDFAITKSIRNFGTQFSKENKFMGKTIAFCVQSEREVAQVPYQFFIKIGDYLVKNGYQLYFVYGPNEKENALKVYNDLRDSSNCIINYEIPTIAQVRAIFENCVMYVGNDGGNKHIAITSGICTIGIFYGDNPLVWTPNEPEKHKYLQTINNVNAFDNFVKLFNNWDFQKRVFNTIE